MAHHWVKAAAVALGASVLAACGSDFARNPVPPEAIHTVHPFGKPGLRSWGDHLNPEELAVLAKESAPRMKAEFGPAIARGETPSVDLLALSGGGQYGAFGAGVLRGWSESGTRPEFEAVFGISTGSIIAPFAFLGAEYDEQLVEIYSKYSTEDLVEANLFSGALFGVALSDTERFANVIAQYVTPAMLEAIAVEYGKGRDLFIGTTNLDAGRPVLWNIGAIAASGEPGALDLFRDLIRASAAIPVAFPPIFVQVETEDGEVYDEMHVDGGASSQVTFVSPQIRIAEGTRRILGRNIERRMWVVVNNDLDPPHRQVAPDVPSIGAAAVSSLIRGSGTGDLYRIYAIAERDEIDFKATWIPSETPCPAPTEDFDPPFMQCLYEFGRSYFKSGKLWRAAPPSFALPTDPVPAIDSQIDTM